MKSAKLIAAIKYLGFKPVVSDWDWRFWIQKVAYILKVLEFGIDFKFIPYRNGVWSYELNQEYSYDYRYAFETLESHYTLSQTDIEKIERMRNSVNLLSSERLEGVTSVLMIADGKANWDENEIARTVKGWKPHLSDATVLLSINDAKKLLMGEGTLKETRLEEDEQWEALNLETLSQAFN